MKNFEYVVDYVELTKQMIADGWRTVGGPFRQGSNPQVLQAFVRYF